MCEEYHISQCYLLNYASPSSLRVSYTDPIQISEIIFI